MGLSRIFTPLLLLFSEMHIKDRFFVNSRMILVPLQFRLILKLEGLVPH